MAKQVKITINVDENKQQALTLYLSKKDSLPELELEETFEKLYEKHVPKEVRDFIEAQSATAPAPPKPPTKKQPEAAPENGYRSPSPISTQ